MQYKAMQSNLKSSEDKPCKAKQRKSKWGEALQSKALQSKTIQNNANQWIILTTDSANMFSLQLRVPRTICYHF